MNTFICQSIGYLFAHYYKNNKNGNIVPETHLGFKELTSKLKITFEEKSKTENDNIVYEQSVKIAFKISDSSILKDLTSAHLILRLKKFNGTILTWGSIEPYNPVQTEINTDEGVATIEFYRQSTEPEL